MITRRFDSKYCNEEPQRSHAPLVTLEHPRPSRPLSNRMSRQKAMLEQCFEAALTANCIPCLFFVHCQGILKRTKRLGLWLNGEYLSHAVALDLVGDNS